MSSLGLRLPADIFKASAKYPPRSSSHKSPLYSIRSGRPLALFNGFVPWPLVRWSQPLERLGENDCRHSGHAGKLAQVSAVVLDSGWNETGLARVVRPLERIQGTTADDRAIA